MAEASTESTPVKSGAAGAAKFVGWDSRKYNYFEPKGRRATHYEDVTVDVQPDPERYLLQDWIISFADGTGAYNKAWTALKSSDWHKFRAPDEEWERTHYARQARIEGMIKQVVDNARKNGAPGHFDKTWLKMIQDHVGALKHAEFGLGTSLMQAQRYGYTQMINNAILTNSSYKLRFAQDLTLYIGEIAMDLDGLDTDAGKEHWLKDPVWQGVREACETIMGSADHLEQYFATNAVFEPLVAELVRSGFVMQCAAAHNDFVTPAVVSSAEADYEHNLANAVELFHILAHDPTYGADNRKVLSEWHDKHVALCTEAANKLQPIWSQPRVKAVQFKDALEHAQNRAARIKEEIGFG
ncbi:MAG: aromatic/alkene monooxygenase hydroxylase subunit beta [Alphaproteobacteria bacterium]|nr:aromatic/alkene monooxygenase hydroxylase subunit beta [Alphaproteobacteria bacterium]